MGTNNKHGFTIIETMLFLAITGLMVLAILVGTGATINIQRYRDSVTTLKSFLQQQYTDVANVRNEARLTDLSCDSNAVVSETAGATKPRGQGDCVIIGRFVVINNTSTEVSMVVGYGSSSPGANNDIKDLKAYKLSLLPGSTEQRELEWGTNIAWPKEGQGSINPTSPRTIAILFLRSPISGLNYTFTADDTTTSLSDMIIAGVSVVGGQSARRLCVDSAGLFDGGLSVYINPYASGPSSIETRSNDMDDTSTC